MSWFWHRRSCRTRTKPPRSRECPSEGESADRSRRWEGIEIRPQTGTLKGPFEPSPGRHGDGQERKAGRRARDHDAAAHTGSGHLLREVVPPLPQAVKMNVSVENQDRFLSLRTNICHASQWYQVSGAQDRRSASSNSGRRPKRSKYSLCVVTNRMRTFLSL